MQLHNAIRPKRFVKKSTQKIIDHIRSKEKRNTLSYASQKQKEANVQSHSTLEVAFKEK